MIFISFEGPEGSGKTTTILKLKAKLKTINKHIIFTREPGGTVISESIRQIIVSKKNHNLDPWTEFLLYIAARRQHLIEKVFPHLIDQEAIIICDRFIDSTIAYQGYARNLDIEKMKQIHDLILGNFVPNLTILFDIKPEIGLKRTKSRQNQDNNRFDEETLSFHQKVYEAYHFLAQENKERIKVIDASQPPDIVAETVYQIIKAKINL